jgi:rhamnulokinase
VIIRCAVESMAASAAQVLASLPPTGAASTRSLRAFGGGIRSPLLLEALERRTSLEISLGPLEAAALGNALAQALALEVFANVDAARATLGTPEEDLP